jgi:hypothetical protein
VVTSTGAVAQHSARVKNARAVSALRRVETSTSITWPY